MSYDISALPRRRPVPVHPLARVLAAAGVTISDAAAILGCTRPWLSPVLNGRAKPGPELAARMTALESELRRELAEESAGQAVEVANRG